jgi:hypothetical protein
MTAQLRTLGDPARHFWLTRSVARTLGVNLSDAMAGGDLTAGDYAALVNRCRTCQCADKCELWLATQSARPSEPPAHCPNAAALARLMR